MGELTKRAAVEAELSTSEGSQTTHEAAAAQRIVLDAKGDPTRLRAAIAKLRGPLRDATIACLPTRARKLR
jgi:hypothetical protein